MLLMYLPVLGYCYLFPYVKNLLISCFPQAVCDSALQANGRLDIAAREAADKRNTDLRHG